MVAPSLPPISPATGIGAPMGNVQAPPVFSDPTPVPPPAVGTPYAPNVIAPPVVVPGAPVPSAAAPAAPVVTPQVLTTLRPAGVPIVATPIGTCAPRNAQYVRLTPHGVMAPIGTEVVLKAGVSDCDGALLPNRRIEWGVAGAGRFSELGSAYQVGRFAWPWTVPRKIADNHAIGNTAMSESVLFSGTPDPNDDVPIYRGEAWVTVTSPCEGTSLVTAFAPSLENYNRVTTQIYWVDAQFIFPPSTAAEPGRPHVLTTTVLRRSDSAPLAGWTVRYDVGGGASLGYEGGNFVETKTDAAGRASVEVSPVDSGGGTTNVAVSIYRPAVGGPGGTPPQGLGSNITTITWGGGAPAVVPGVPTAPSLPSNGAPGLPGPPTVDPYSPNPYTPSAPSLPSAPYTPSAPGSSNPYPSAPPVNAPQSTSPPTPTPEPYAPPAGEQTTGRPVLDVQLDAVSAVQVPVGESVRFEVKIANRGNATARGIGLRADFSPGLKHLKAQPGETSIVYPKVDDLAPGETTSIMLTFELAAEGEQCHTVTVSATGAQPVSKRGCAIGTKPEIESFRITGLRSAVVGQRADFNMTIRNGDAMVRDAAVVLKFDPALEPIGLTGQEFEKLQDGSILMRIGDIGPREQRSFPPIQATCKSQSNNACLRADLASGGNFLTTADACVEILPPAPSGTDGGIFGP
jgi:hypothetical protein